MRVAITHCPNPACPNHKSPPPEPFYIKKGYYRTKHDRRQVPRYKCKTCGRNFSTHTFRSTYQQHKPFVNVPLFKLLASSVTQRRSAKVLGVNRKTVVRKFHWMAFEALMVHSETVRTGGIQTSYVQFDEMESYEHTKLKPVTIAVAVRPKTGEIIDIEVAAIPASGHLADLSVRKYGRRPDNGYMAREGVLRSVTRCAKPGLTIATDGHPAYPGLVERWCPGARLKTCVRVNESPIARRERGKKVPDPLFWANHIAARLRADISRLVRRTWSTTKREWCLQEHLSLYIAWNNGYDLKIG
jgi:transposase-like protein